MSTGRLRPGGMVSGPVNWTCLVDITSFLENCLDHGVLKILQAMDRRWPWKKKSSDKAERAVASDVAALASAGSQGDQENYKKPNYVQISIESYSRLSSLEEQVKAYEEQVQTLEDQIMDLDEKLSAANAEINNKENLVKQHTRVAEEAVSGWEKAEAEALALKNHLESVTLSKLTIEDRASHLDGALKECMRQIRNLKEEHEQKVQDVVLTKNKQCERIKLELEAKIANFEQELLKAAAENAALSRSLQERSNMLIEINEEKSKAEAEIELLKSNIESCEKEISSLKYELHVVSKQLEIRNEEKNMSMRSAEATNKQHMEGVKKIAKLEAECQRLRGLVRKKLPGPAALAQMKLEVESLGWDYGDTRPRRSPVKPSSPHLSPVMECSLEKEQKFQKENELLTERLLAMEEETKMLKEALAKRNSELLASRNLCAKTTSKLQSLEAQLQISSQQKAPPSVVSVSEDGNDDNGSCADSWATVLISDLSQFNKENNNEKSSTRENSKHLGLMDDFLEMEKLACLSDDTNANGAITISDVSDNNASESLNGNPPGEVISDKDTQSNKQFDVHAIENQVSSTITDADIDEFPVMKLRARILVVLESISKDADGQKILEDIKNIVQDAHDTLTQRSANSVAGGTHCSGLKSNGHACSENGGSTPEKEISLSQDSKVGSDIMQIMSEELVSATSQIHDFVLSLGKEARLVEDLCADGIGLAQKIEDFSVTFNKVLWNSGSLADFVLDLSHVLCEASELNFNVLGYKGDEVEISSPDCIDKVALPENKVIQKDSSRETYQDGRNHISNPEIPDDGTSVSDYESKRCKISLEEFEELKLEKDKMSTNLARCTENMEITKSQLNETEQLLAEAKLQLAASQKSNGLAETQLKCMAESYRSLETRARELETEVKLLREKIEILEDELQDEKRSCQDALSKCKELEEQLLRNESCSVSSSAADNDLKTKQERELAAAAEKLAECQETIFLLGKQLNSLRPRPDFVGSRSSESRQKGDGLPDEEPTTSGTIMQDLDQAEMDTADSSNMQQTDSVSPMDLHKSLNSPSDTESRSPSNTKHPKHRPTKSSSSSFSPALTPEKHSRGFSRFFSSKGKNYSNTGSS